MKRLIIIPLLFILFAVQGQIGRYPFYRPTAVVAAEDEYPEELDANTVAMYLYDESSTLTMNGDHLTKVIEWKDYFESGNDLDVVSATWTQQPTLTATGVLMDGEDQWIKGTFTLNQPITIYLVFKQVTWSRWDFVFDGNSDESGYLQQGSSDNSAYLVASAGTALQDDGKLALNTYGIVRVVFNGANSSLQINENTAVTGAGGSGNMGGFTLGRMGTTDSWRSNIEVKAVIIRSVADNGTVQGTIYDWLEGKYL